MNIESALRRGLKYRRDVIAVRKGRVLPRIERRVVGKISGRMMGRMFG